MPEETNIQIKQKSLTLLVAAIVLVVLGIVSFVFHVSPQAMLTQLAEFSKHHYLIVSVTFLIAAVVILKLVGKNVKEVEDNETRKISAGQKWLRHMRAIRRNLNFSIKAKSPQDHYQFIAKTQLYAMRFFDEDVLTQQDEKNRRDAEISSAIRLGKQHRQKVVICFKTIGGEMYTIASLTTVFENDIVLSDGTKIPIRSIYKIEL